MDVSPGSIEDVPRVAALYRATFDDRLSTVTGIRHRQASARPEDALRFWRAEEDGELIGWAFAGLDSFAAVRTTASASIVVHPAHRRAGAGSALWDEASAHLDAIGARRIVAYSRADDDTVAFVGARGFTLESTDTTSAVDPRTLPEPPDPPSGVIIAPMAAHAEDPTPVFEADKESALDEPGPSDFSGVTYETWRRQIWEYPDCDHELSVVAEVDGVVVGTVVPLLGSRDRPRDERGDRRRSRLSRPWPRPPDEAALACPGGGCRDHEGNHPERRDQRADARDQQGARLPAALLGARLGARALGP